MRIAAVAALASALMLGTTPSHLRLSVVPYLIDGRRPQRPSRFSYRG